VVTYYSLKVLQYSASKNFVQPLLAYRRKDGRT